jgi:DNA repair protein RecO (recombination protein O)
MLITTRGIIFRTVKYGETSIIADIFTESHGLQTCIIAGVRKAGSKTQAGLLQVMSITELVLYYRPDQQMHRIREIRAAYVYQRIPFDIRRSAVGLFMTELCRKTIRETEENRPLFQFLYDRFAYLDATHTSVANYHLHFMLELSVYLGFVPGEDWTPETPFFDLKEGLFSARPGHPYYIEEGLSQQLYALLTIDYRETHQVGLGTLARRRLLQELITYYKLHLEHFTELHAHHILQEVFE